MHQWRFCGNGLVEFSLVFPLFVLLGLILVDLVFLSVHKFLLEIEGESAGRLLAHSELKTADEMKEGITDWFQKRTIKPQDVSVVIEALKPRVNKSDRRSGKIPQIIRLKIKGQYHPFCPFLIPFMKKEGFVWTYETHSFRILSLIS